MKRFLALFAIVAMVVSMFSGVAFANSDPDYKIDLDTAQITYRKGPTNTTLSGRILNYSTNALVRESFTLKIYKEGDHVDGWDISVSNGRFSIQIPTYNEAFGVGNYHLVLDGENANPQKFTIVQKIELETPAELKYSFPVSGQKIVQGVFVNSDGPKTANPDVIIAYQADVNSILESLNGKTLEDDLNYIAATYDDDKAFGFLFNGAWFNKTGKIGIYIAIYNQDGDLVNVVLAHEGEILHDAMDLTVSPLVFYNKLGIDQNVKLEFNFHSRYISNGAIHSDYGLFISVKDKFEENVTSSYGDKKVEFNLEAATPAAISTWAAGTYKLVAELKHTDGFIAEKAEVEIKVEEPDDFTLVNWTTAAMNIGSYNFKVAELTPNGTDYRYIDVRYFDGTNVKSVLHSSLSYKVRVTHEGAGLAKKTTTITKDSASDILAINPTRTGTIAMTIEVLDSADKVLEKFERTIEVKGWNIEVTPKTALVDVKTDYAVVVTDENGNPINRAVVVIADGDNQKHVVNSTTTNINNGTYLFKEKALADVGKYDIVAMTVAQFDGLFDGSNDYQGKLTNAIEVMGEEVLFVDTDTPVMVNGIKDDIYVTVLDENGDVVYPVFEIVFYDSSDKEVSTIQNYSSGADGYNSSFVTSTRKDISGDGVREAIKLVVTPPAKATSMEIRAYTDGERKEMGKVTAEVVKPEVVHTKSTIITENFKTDVEFTVIDPRDGSVLKNAITFDSDTDYVVVAYSANDKELKADKDNVWTATLLIKDVNWDDAKDDEEDVVVAIMMSNVELELLEVAKSTLTSNPERIIIGAPTNIVLTYLNGEGNPISGKTVKLDGVDIGKTDEDGQLVYAASSVSSISLKFEAASDVSAAPTSLTVRSTADVEGPKATIEVDGMTAIIRITDNVRVSKVMINGQLIDMFFAMPEVTHMVTLSPGVNTFNVQAVDINNNYTQTTLTAEPVTASVTFTIGEATQYGTPVLVDGTTMVPVRFAEALGAVVTWDAPTATITYVAGDKVIVLTVGSTTAIVNGENVQIARAPFINELNRTMVPLRMIAQELGFNVVWTSNTAPISITK